MSNVGRFTPEQRAEFKAWLRTKDAPLNPIQKALAKLKERQESDPTTHPPLITKVVPSKKRYVRRKFKRGEE